MAKKKPQVRIKNWGIYTPWDQASKALPELIKSTYDIPCQAGIEFGYIANIKKAKNKKLKYCIYHPDIPGEDGKPMPPFSGEEFIRQNDWNFFIGDTVWEPVENKAGPWRITLAIEGEVIADRTFRLQLPPP